MNDTNLIDSCQAHLPVRYTCSIIGNTGVVINREPHLSHACKTSLLFALLAVRVQAGCSAFPFYTRTKPLIQLNFIYKTVLIPKLKLFFIF